MMNEKLEVFFRTKKLGKLYFTCSTRFLNILDSRVDKKICGFSLCRYVPSLYRETRGATGSEATRYAFLKKIFKNADFTSDDRLIDVGCGKGRVLAFFIREKFPGKFEGVELNQEVADLAVSWSKKYENVKIFHGDAFLIDYNDYTVITLGRPFETKAFIEFVGLIESQLKHPIKVFYWWDSQSGNYLNNRPGWELIERDTFYNIGIFPAYSYRQRYSIWTYDPQKR